MNSIELICINCPKGCVLSAQQTPFSVTGNGCAKGLEYARAELTDPRRTVTAAVRTDSTVLPYLPVKTTGPIQKKYIKPLLDALFRVTIHTPISAGTVIIENFQNSGVAVICTRACG